MWSGSRWPRLRAASSLPCGPTAGVTGTLWATSNSCAVQVRGPDHLRAVGALARTRGPCRGLGVGGWRASRNFFLRADGRSDFGTLMFGCVVIFYCRAGGVF